MNEPRGSVAFEIQWTEVAAHECSRLATVSGGAEHIGTTALLGSPGRPVIDILVGVRMLDRRADLVVSALAEFGYEPVGSRWPGALALRRRGSTDFDVFLVELGGREWKRGLALRDYFRRNGDEARSYVRLLKEAAAAAADDVPAYEEAKQRILQTFGSRADNWRLAHHSG